MGDWTGTVPTLTAGAKFRGSDADTLADIATAETAAWTSYSCTWRSLGTQPALGNGTLVSVYRRVGKTVNIMILLTIGSTSTFGTSAYYFDLPVASTREAMGVATAFDTSGGAFFAAVGLISAGGGLAGLSYITPLTASTNALMTSAAPMTWATGDTLRVTATYETA